MALHAPSPRLCAGAGGAHCTSDLAESEPAMALEQAWQLLATFTKQEAAGLARPLLDAPEYRAQLRDALLVAAAEQKPAGAGTGSDVLLGVVASDVRLAVRSLRDYCEGLGLPFVPPESQVCLQRALLWLPHCTYPDMPGAPQVSGVAVAAAITGPVYIKLNSASGLCYASRCQTLLHAGAPAMGDVQAQSARCVLT